MSTPTDLVAAGPAEAVSPQARQAVEELKHYLHAKLLDRLDFHRINALAEDRRRTELRPAVEHLLDAEKMHLSAEERDWLIAELLDEVLGLGPLEKLLRDPTVSDILVNSPAEVYVERRGQLEPAAVRFRNDDHLLQVIDRIVSKVGRRIDETSPMVDARLPDGSRVNAVIPPVTLRGPSLSIRRFGASPLRLDDLLALQSLTPEMALLLEAAVKARLNVVISGGTGSGKTTLLNTLSAFIPDGERIITIEDAAELQLQQRHVVPMETRPPNIEGKGQITMRDLVRNALRMRPDRIIVGECRGAEALDMLQAMNTGHEGSLTTLHANSPHDALARLETMILMAGYDLPVKAMRQQIASAVNLLVQAERLQGGLRRVTSVSEVVGMEQDVILLQELFIFRQKGVNAEGRAVGRFEAMGGQPNCAPRIQAAGIKLPADLFAERVLLRV